MDFKVFSKNYIRALIQITKTIVEPTKNTLPSFFTNPGFFVVLSDSTGRHLIEIYSLEKTRELKINSDVFKYSEKTGPKTIFLEVRLIEDYLFSHTNDDNTHCVIIDKRHICLSNLIFGKQEFFEIYPDYVTGGTRFVAGTIPFRVTNEGLMLGLNLHHCYSLYGKPTHRTFEFIEVFGNEKLFP